jgi:hypothetical protein
MTMRLGRIALLFGLLMGPSVNALAEESGTAGKEAVFPNPQVQEALSQTADAGSLGTAETLPGGSGGPLAVVGSSQPTRSFSTLSALKRSRLRRGAGPVGYAVRSNAPVIILGVRF